MDDRQAQVTERAGLDDTRINEDFRDFLLKWGPWALVVVALVFGGIGGKRYLDQQRDQRVDEAFVQLSLATEAQGTSPDTLLGLADSYADVRGVPLAARLAAADAYLAAVRRGVVVGAVPGPDGGYQEEELLDAELRASYLDQAAALYERVAAEAGREPGAAVHAIGALLGQAAIAESRGDLDAAREAYQRAADLDRSVGYGMHARVIEQRLATLDTLAEPVDLPAQAALPQPDAPAAAQGEEQEEGDDPFGLGEPGAFEDLLLGGDEPADGPADEPADEPGDEPETSPADPPASPPAPPAEPPAEPSGGP